MVDAEVVRDPISTLNLVISPDARSSLQINLVTEIVVTGVDDEEHDLNLNFLALRPPSIYRASEIGNRTCGCVCKSIKGTDFPRSSLGLRTDAFGSEQDTSHSRS